MSSALSALRSTLELFSAGPLPEWHRVTESAETIQLATGESLLEAGTTDSDAYWVEKGLLKAHHPAPNGPDRTVYFLEATQVFASGTAMFGDGLARLISTGADPRSRELAYAVRGDALTTITALEPTTVHRLPSDVLRGLAIQYREWGLLVQTLMMAHMVELGMAGARARSMTIEEHYLFLAEYRPNLVARLKQRELAIYLGATEPGLSRIIKRVRQKELAQT